MFRRSLWKDLETFEVNGFFDGGGGSGARRTSDGSRGIDKVLEELMMAESSCSWNDLSSNES